MKKYDNREEMKRILLAGNLNSNNDDSWNVRRILEKDGKRVQAGW